MTLNNLQVCTYNTIYKNVVMLHNKQVFSDPTQPECHFKLKGFSGNVSDDYIQYHVSLGTPVDSSGEGSVFWTSLLQQSVEIEVDQISSRMGTLLNLFKFCKRNERGIEKGLQIFYSVL